MSRSIIVVPSEGRRVRHPDGRLLDAQGARVERTAYWQRKANAGDVIFSKSRKAAKASSRSEEQP